MLRISYGYKANFDISDPFIKLAEMFCDVLSKSCALGKWLVDSLPSCTYSNSPPIPVLMHILLSKERTGIFTGNEVQVKGSWNVQRHRWVLWETLPICKEQLGSQNFSWLYTTLTLLHVGTWNCYRLFHLRVTSGQYRYWWRYSEGCIINPVRRRCRHSEFRASRHE